jgi:hypothetical protein
MVFDFFPLLITNTSPTHKSPLKKEYSPRKISKIQDAGPERRINDKMI